MRALRQSLQNGFTLVEIVFVLAISGIIITLVFLVVPQAQVTRRDAQRKTYLGLVAANVDKYKESEANNYQYPADNATFDHAFDPADNSLTPPHPYAVTTNDTDPLSNTTYKFGTTAQTPSSSQSAGIVYAPDVSCAGIAVGGAGGLSIYSVTITLEDGASFCIDNH